MGESQPRQAPPLVELVTAVATCRVTAKLPRGVRDRQ